MNPNDDTEIVERLAEMNESLEAFMTFAKRNGFSDLRDRCESFYGFVNREYFRRKKERRNE